MDKLGREMNNEMQPHFTESCSKKLPLSSPPDRQAVNFYLFARKPTQYTDLSGLFTVLVPQKTTTNSYIKIKVDKKQTIYVGDNIITL